VQSAEVGVYATQRLETAYSDIVSNDQLKEAAHAMERKLQAKGDLRPYDARYDGIGDRLRFIARQPGYDVELAITDPEEIADLALSLSDEPDTLAVIEAMRNRRGHPWPVTKD